MLLIPIKNVEEAKCNACGGNIGQYADAQISVRCKCGEDVRINRSSVNKESGVRVMHDTLNSVMDDMLAALKTRGVPSGKARETCAYRTFVPPEVWCPVCQMNFVPGWEARVISGTSEQVAEAEWRHDPIVRQYRTMARNFVQKYGPLSRVECISHYPDFEVRFVFGKKEIYSGKRRSGYDIHFLRLGYFGEGPRLAQQFLDEAGLAMSADDIGDIKAGAVISLRNGKPVVDYPSQPPRKEEKKWWQIWS